MPAAQSDTSRPEPADARRLPAPGRWITAAIILVLLAMVVKGAAVSPNMRWDQVRHYFFISSILRGLLLTLELTAVAMVVGVVVGALVAFMRMSSNPVARIAGTVYIWLFRGTPLLVQLLFWYYIAAVLPRVGIGIPFGPTFTDWSTNSLISKFTAAVLALGLHEAGFSAEVIRSGIMSVDRGQREAADVLGLSPWQAMRKIVIPQAMRFIVPPLGNSVISTLKSTSLVLVIGLLDLTTSVENIYSQNFLQIPLLVVAVAWYLISFTVLSILQHYLERRLGRSVRRDRTPGAAGAGTPRPGQPLATPLAPGIAETA